MAEAEAVLAETNAYFNARKQVLVEKHVEGRESVQDLDHLYPGGRIPNAPPNYLDAHEDALNRQYQE